MQDANDETIAGIFQLAKKLMRPLIKGLACDYVNISVNGKDIPHFHVHLIPRFFNDGLVGWQTKKYKDGESKEVARKIIQAF
jgi:diadenosine tetraphosphate (Ap4A) HIT family hydrolase